jgi:hypothetical protein
MARALPFILLIALLSSCASIISRRNYRIGIRSDAREAKIRYKDSTYVLPTVIRVRRAKTPLALDFITPDTTKAITVRSKPNAAFVVGNLGWMQVAPLAYLIDLTTTRRFTYGKNLYLHAADTSTVYPISRKLWQRYWGRSYEPAKGDVSLVVSIPVVNHFMFQPAGEPTKEGYGCLGVSSGLSYAFRDRRSLVIAGGFAVDIPEPLPFVFTDYAGFHESRQSTWMGLMEMRHFRRLSFGYGLCFSRNTWKIDYIDRWDTTGLPPPAGYPIEKSRSAAGIMAAAYFRPNRVINVGVQYRSSLLDMGTGTIGPYEHVVSLDLAFPVNLVKRSEKRKGLHR